MKALVFLFAIAAAGQPPTLYTDHASNSRLATVQEGTITPANVSKLSLKATMSLDDIPYTSPLYIPGITIGGINRNVLFVGTAKNSVYAFDADTFQQLWKTNTGDAPCTSTCNNYGWAIATYSATAGIFSAPVIDVANGWIFVVIYTNAPIYKLYKLNLLTGSVISSVTVTASVSPSTAADAVAGVLTFNPLQATQRAGLTLANGNVYMMFSSVRDGWDNDFFWHGWILAYRETDLAQVAHFCTNWNQRGGGLWMSNSGASVDPDGNIYVTTGNGGSDSATWASSYDGITEWSMSAIKFSPALEVLDWFTPSNYATLNQLDADLGSSHPMLIPNPASAGKYLLVTGGKDFHVYSIPTDCMGHLGGTVGGCPGPQILTTGSDPGTHLGIYGGTHLNGISYFPNTNGPLYAFQLLNTGLYNPTPVIGSTVAYPGAITTGSINGSSNAILWAVTADSGTLLAASAGRLRALDPTTLNELWSVTIGTVQKFLNPTVANGRVYVSTRDSVVLAFGLPSQTQVSGQVTVNGRATIQ